MSQASNYLENKLIDHLFRAGSFAKPTGLYVGLLTSAPSDAGGGTEFTGGAYARANLAPSDTNWSATQGGTSGASSGVTGITQNAVAITFPVPTASWGTATHYGIYDALSGGNLLVFGALAAQRTVVLGDPAPAFDIGALSVTVA